MIAPEEIVSLETIEANQETHMLLAEKQLDKWLKEEFLCPKKTTANFSLYEFDSTSFMTLLEKNREVLLERYRKVGWETYVPYAGAKGIYFSRKDLK